MNTQAMQYAELVSRAQAGDPGAKRYLDQFLGQMQQQQQQPQQPQQAPPPQGPPQQAPPNTPPPMAQEPRIQELMQRAAAGEPGAKRFLDELYAKGQR